MTGDRNNRGRSGGDGPACPNCWARLSIEWPEFFGDVRCPNCGEMLFWLRPGPPTGNSHSLFHNPGGGIRQRAIEIVAEPLGVDKAKIKPGTSFVNDLGAESLDTVELVMELEQGFGEGS